MLRRIAFAAVLCPLALGCTPPKSAEPTNNIEAGAALSAGAENSAQSYEVARTGQPFGGTCYSWSNTTDADGDSFPASASLTLSGCSEVVDGTTITADGSAAITDPNDASAAFEFDADVALVRGASNDEGSLSSSYDGAVSGTNPGSTYDLVEGSSGTRNVSEVSADIGSVSTTITETFYRTTQFTPTGGGSWDWENGLVTGSMVITGESHFSSIDEDTDIDTPTPLAIDPACGTLIVAGELRATYEGAVSTSRITVQWSGCGERSIDYEE